MWNRDCKLEFKNLQQMFKNTLKRGLFLSKKRAKLPQHVAHPKKRPHAHTSHARFDSLFARTLHMCKRARTCACANLFSQLTVCKQVCSESSPHIQNIPCTFHCGLFQMSLNYNIENETKEIFPELVFLTGSYWFQFYRNYRF